MGKKRRNSTSSSSDDEELRLRRKIRKLQRKLDRFENSDSDKENGSLSGSLQSRNSEAQSVFLPQEQEINNIDRETEEHHSVQDPLEVVDTNPLNEEILNLLGKDDSPNNILGDIIHKDLALRWESILSKGLKEETRNTLLKKYPPIKNCPLVAAPKLNLEVKVAVNEGAVKRDARLANMQGQIGASLTALGKALTILLGDEETTEGHPNNNLRLIEAISDSARLLADTHFQESEARRSLLSLKLNKDLKETMINAGIDGWLFGENLGERVKVAKAVEKSGQELKTVPLKPNRPRVIARSNLNVKGPSRNARLGGHKYQQLPRGNSTRRIHQS